MPRLADRSKTFPVVDRPREAGPDYRIRYRAKPTGEYRPPKADEWYLSGAIVEAYRAPNDLSPPYFIARIVRAKQVSTWVEIDPEGN